MGCLGLPKDRPKRVACIFAGACAGQVINIVGLQGEWKSTDTGGKICRPIKYPEGIDPCGVCWRDPRIALLDSLLSKASSGGISEGVMGSSQSESTLPGKQNPGTHLLCK